MKFSDYYMQKICSICKRKYETKDSESKKCPLCKADELRCKTLDGGIK